MTEDSTNEAGTSPAPNEAGKRTAGAFDIRVIIGGLIGAYGIILLLLGLFDTSDAELARADGFNVNLWAGLGMIAVAGGFILWARLKPVVVSVTVERTENDQ